ncbi:MFS transporter [Caulobacter sp. Root655]|uniref:MFS transporter n=1 Tax=Caulobacter sp. Root655 TaxID=1736578 RepID=UPI0006F88D27|nr:MFS transporter [Caulobacter sp. Root655]KRA60462.1 MFS transporter [Caulobacter sp. Root655]
MTAEAPSPTGAWIGDPPSLVQRLAVFWVGLVGVLFPGVGPLLLGGMEAAGRLTAAQIGQAGMAELVAMGVGAAIVGPLFGERRLRLAAVGCGLLLAALDMATTRMSGDALTLVRALAGLPAGAMIWLITGMIVRAPRPERWAGLYLTIQTLLQLGVVAGIGAFVVGPFGPDGGFVVLAILTVSAAVVGLAVPRAYAPLAEAADNPKGLPSPRGWIALAAVLCFQAFILAAWIYVEPLSRQAGHPTTTASAAFAVSLAAQVAGGAVATALAGRLSWFWSLTVAVLVAIGALLVMASLPSAVMFLAVSGLFGFVWLFASPFLTPLAIEADPSRRAALLGPGASLLGCGAGPLLASFVVTGADVRPAVWLGVILAVITLVIIAGLHLTRPRFVA